MGKDLIAERLERARQGDLQAFAELFEGLRPMVHAIAYRLTGPDDAEDVVMNTFLRAWRALPGFGGRSALKTWLFRIAHNCALDAVRQRRRHEAEPLPGAGPAAPAAEIPDRRGRSPAEETAGREIAALIREALDRLSPDHRRTLLLRFADGLSYADIATATGVSIGTVMSRLFNGRRKLQRLLSQAGLGPRPAPPVNGVKEDLHEPRVLA